MKNLNFISKIVLATIICSTGYAYPSKTTRKPFDLGSISQGMNAQIYCKRINKTPANEYYDIENITLFMNVSKESGSANTNTRSGEAMVYLAGTYDGAPDAFMRAALYKANLEMKFTALGGTKISVDNKISYKFEYITKVPQQAGHAPTNLPVTFEFSIQSKTNWEGDSASEDSSIVTMKTVQTHVMPSSPQKIYKTADGHDAVIMESKVQFEVTEDYACQKQIGMF